MVEDVLGNAVVEHALAVQNLMLLGVESRGIILEKLDKGPRLRSFIKDFGLAFINAAAIFHRNFLWKLSWHLAICVAPCMN
jgi:hypothetical protein